jgi:lipoprotein-anchoring transpeptidase ErfK/SrfK
MQKIISRSLLIISALSLPAALQAQSGSQTSGTSSNVLNGFSLSVPDDVSKDVFSGSRREQVLTAQVLLDRSRHSPGVIDGYMGGNTRRAIRYYRDAHGLPAGDGLDQRLMRSLIETQSGDVFTSYTITQDDVDVPFYDVPSGMAAMAKMERVGWKSPQEMFADRFHMDQGFLAALNPNVDFGRAGTKIMVISQGEEKLPGEVAKIEIRKSDNSVVALNANGEVLASYPATIGSSQFPSPSGSMQVAAVAPEANYTFDPSGRKWGPDKTLVIPPGPNNPVGGIWIDLSKEGYGIHGSPDPHLIGKTSSHGCVRLTNWDASELAGAVSKGVDVVFL